VHYDDINACCWCCVTGSPGLSDPCEKEPTDVTDCLTSQQREEVTASAQVCLASILTTTVCAGHRLSLQEAMIHYIDHTRHSKSFSRDFHSGSITNIKKSSENVTRLTCPLTPSHQVFVSQIFCLMSFIFICVCACVVHILTREKKQKVNFYFAIRMKAYMCTVLTQISFRSCLSSLTSSNMVYPCL